MGKWSFNMSNDIFQHPCGHNVQHLVMPSSAHLNMTGLEHTRAANGITSNGTEPIKQHAISSTATRGWIDTGYAGTTCMYKRCTPPTVVQFI